MREYIDTANNQKYGIDDTVVVTDGSTPAKTVTWNGAAPVAGTVPPYTFTTKRGVALVLPKTLIPFVPPVLTAAQQAAATAAAAAASAVTAYKVMAQKALAATDSTMTRIAEGVALGLTTYAAADVVAFVQYRRELRAIISASAPNTATPLPAQPPYPAGT